MNNDDIKNGKETVVCLAAAFMTGVLFLLIMMLIKTLPGDEFVFAQGDALLQTAAFARMFTRHLITGGSLDFSFEMGLGMETGAVYAFYALSPMNLLFLVFEDSATAVFWITFCKLVLGAAFMALAIQQITRWRSFLIVGLASAYALCAFSMNLYIALFLLDIIYLFPLLIVGVKYFVDEGKMLRLILLYALCFAIQFYCAYIMGVCSAVIFLAYAWYCYGKERKLWWKSISKYAICVMVAILISAPVTLPAAKELFTYRLEDVTHFQTHILSLWNFLKGLFPHKGEGAYNSVPLLYAGVSILLLTAGFFADQEIGRRKKIATMVPVFFLMISCFWTPLYRFMHAFDAPDGYDYRFSPCFSFIIVMVASMELKKMQGRKGKYKFWILTALVFGGIYILLFEGEKYSMADQRVLEYRGVLFVFVVLLMYSLCFILGLQKKGISIVFLLLICGEILFHAELTLQGREMMTKDEYELMKGQSVGGLDHIAFLEKEESPSFYRIFYRNNLTDNVSMIYGYHGAGCFSSILNGNIREFMKKSGYATTNLMIMDYGSTNLMRMLLAQKYTIDCHFYLQNRWGEYAVSQNEFVLPLGYMVDEGVENYWDEGGDPFCFQNGLISAMTGNEHRVYTKNEVVNAECSGLELQNYEGGTLIIPQMNPGETGYVMFWVPKEPNEEAYAYISRWGESAVDPYSPWFFSDTDIGDRYHISSITLPHIIPLSADAEKRCRAILRVAADNCNNLTYEDILCYYENKGELEKAYEELKNGGMNINSFSDDNITGTVNVTDEKKLLFTSIPYNSEWEAYVDGERVPIIPLLHDAFCGIRLEKGVHELRFVYKSRWNRWGKGIGAVGVFIWCGLLYREKRRKAKAA